MNREPAEQDMKEQDGASAVGDSVDAVTDAEAVPTNEGNNDASISGDLDQTNEAIGLAEDQREIGETSGFEEEAADTEGQEADALIEELRSELSAAQAKAAEYLDQLQRTAAEFQNSRRRQERQLAEETQQANANLIRRLLPVLDDLDLAFQNLPAELQSETTGNIEDENDAGTEARLSWVDGFRQIRKKLLDILLEQGLSVIDASGEFDPMRHEAITSEPHDTVESGHVIEEVRAGYEYKGRILRPSLVRVAL